MSKEETEKGVELIHYEGEKCDMCKRRFKRIVRMYGVFTVDVCESCLRKALKLIEEESDD